MSVIRKPSVGSPTMLNTRGSKSTSLPEISIMLGRSGMTLNTALFATGGMFVPSSFTITNT